MTHKLSHFAFDRAVLTIVLWGFSYATWSAPLAFVANKSGAFPGGSVDAYINAVHQIPVLTLDEEQALARRYNAENDLEAAKRLVLAHLRFVVHVARGYNGYGLQISDLIQEGNIGLMKAVKRFDPEMGVRLVSFAVHWIRAEMHEFILRNWRIVKIATTKAQRKLFFNLRKSKKRLGWMNDAEARTITEILRQLLTAGVRPEDIGVITPYRGQLERLVSIHGHADLVLVLPFHAGYHGSDARGLAIHRDRRTGRLTADADLLRAAVDDGRAGPEHGRSQSDYRHQRKPVAPSHGIPSG